MQNIGSTLSLLWRQKSKTAGTLFLLSTLFFVLFLLVMVVSFTIQTVEKAERQIQISFFLVEGIEDYKVALLRAQLLKMERDGQIYGVEYKTADQNLKEYSSSQPDRFQFLRQNLGDNIPLTDSFIIIPASHNLESLLDFFINGDFKDTIDTQKLRQNSNAIIESKKVLEFLGFLRISVIGVIILVLLGISIITASFIASSFHSRKNEVFIMRLVGATAGFIRIPFIIESLILTVLGLCIGWGIFFIVRHTVLTQFMSIFSSPEEYTNVAISINAMWGNFLQTLPIIFGTIIVFTSIATIITIENILRKREIL